jgi:hypothetical protein
MTRKRLSILGLDDGNGNTSTQNQTVINNTNPPASTVATLPIIAGQ